MDGTCGRERGVSMRLLNKRGDTIIEVLVAMLIAVLGIVILASCVISASNINGTLTSEYKDVDLHKDAQDAEFYVDVYKTQTGSDTRIDVSNTNVTSIKKYQTPNGYYYYETE